MDITQILKENKEKVDIKLTEFFDKGIEEAQKQDEFVAGILEYAKKFSLSGGKRLRPILMQYGYLASGGQEMEKILKASLSVELVHIFLLIHDDIMDRDTLRHGQDTVHVHYQKKGKKLFKDLDSEHFGLSIALVAGDIIGAMGNQILYDSKFDPEYIMRALSKLQSVISLTVFGQVKDICIEYSKEATEEEILRMYEYKTARYTVEGPLLLGSILGGGSDELAKVLSDYSIPLGIAFQIQDDILGVFGSEEKLGKHVGSDIREGKMTLLVSKAIQESNGSDRGVLQQILRKGSTLGMSDIVRFRDIVRSSGALEYAKNLANQYVEQGKQALLTTDLVQGEARDFLLGVADHMAKREY